MPFYGLSDAQMIWENESSKQAILDRMDNNGFIKYIENSDYTKETKSKLSLNSYYDTEEFDYKIILKKYLLLYI